ncbi:inovirus-type Gp2 protein [Pseudoalteromonas sp. SR45-4]|uniref:YagK/YfjJ domain-containing protein n=1 Tax=Pseudoalteromonas sp. SR45-4 TaxID=2760929 RepID=UPI0015F7AFA3|nr:inovirus-type Gp2 protein [Pseudoalteromonas sp. SR45-4]MBB1370300.1 inovirus-type Gp2 protein [Pseudoalteromonas sp. SR45-4]
MSYKMKTRFLEVNEQIFWVNGKHSGIYSAMAKKMINQVDVMLNHHSKVHLVRFDLRLYEFTQTNQVITKFNRILFKWLKRSYNLKRIGFIWCREIETAKQQHYHYVLMLDGHKIRHPHDILSKVKMVWEHQLQGSQYTPKHCYYNIKRGDYNSLQQAIWRISYLAKVRGKGQKPPQTKNYSTSRIKHKLGSQKR